VPGILTKPAGSAGHLAFTIAHAASGHWLLQDFAFDAAPAALHGTVELGDDVRLQIERAGGGYRIALRGGLLDTRPFLHEALANAGSTPGPDIELAAK